MVERNKMCLNDRARQFLPFDSVKGLRDAIKLKEYEHERISKGDLSEDMINKISDSLMNFDKNKNYSVRYFIDGRYEIINGKMKLNVNMKYILINDIKISFDDIMDINIIL